MREGGPGWRGPKAVLLAECFEDKENKEQVLKGVSRRCFPPR